VDEHGGPAEFALSRRSFSPGTVKRMTLTTPSSSPAPTAETDAIAALAALLVDCAEDALAAEKTPASTPRP